MASVVVLELNEVPWKVLDWWTARHPDGGLADLVRSSRTFTSVAVDEGHLSPWITWPTVHRGVPNTVHGIGHFGQDTTHADRVAPPWWTTVAAGGRRVGVFGLLHTAELPEDLAPYDFYVPDTFAPTERTHPAALEPFQAFNLRMARASARNVSTSIDVGAAARFLARAPRLGLRPATVAALVRQLVDERRHPHVRVRRRSFQAVLAFDLFLGQLRRNRPEASAFFTNHVASAMHRYWAATFPEDYPPESFGFDDDWIRTWSGELDAALVHADRMVARLLREVRRTGATLVVASSMGQQAAQGTPVARQLYLRDLGRFLGDAGIGPEDFEPRPAMDPQANVSVRGEATARLRARLAALRIGGREIEWHEEAEGFFSLTFGQADDAIGEVTVDGTVRAPEDLGLVVIEIEDEVSSTGYHVPEGVLLVCEPGREPAGDQRRREVPTTAVAPFLHRLVGLEPAAHHAEDGLALFAGRPSVRDQ